MIKRTVTWAILAFIVAAGVSRAAEPVKIGAVFARSGRAAPVCDAAFKGTRLAVEELNRSGGLINHPIHLVEYDNQSTPIGARKAAATAAKDGVCGLIGAVYSSHSMAMAPVAEQHRIPMISPISTHPELTVNRPYVFRVCFTDNFQGKVMADFALRHLKAATSVVLTNTTSKYSTGLARVFIHHFNQSGRVLWEGEYREDAVDFKSQINTMKDLKADVAFVPGHYRESAYIIKQSRLMGLNLTFLGGDGWLDQMYTYGGDYIPGNYYCTQWHHNSPRPASQRFVKAYTRRYGRITNEPVMALAYDAVMVFAAAVRRAGTFDTPTIRRFLAQTRDHDGVTGLITFDVNGDPIDKSAVVLKFDNYDSVYFKTVRP